uniref:Uncharacterized protein n=1 Tax=Aegilops tauschii subsp. strangulata TaxID=200361 RepID=A0A453EPX0_AEGTS
MTRAAAGVAAAPAWPWSSWCASYCTSTTCTSDGAKGTVCIERAGSMRKRTGRGGSTRCHIQKARTHGCDSKVGEECAVYLGAMQDGYGTVVGPTWSILIIMENDG